MFSKCELNNSKFQREFSKHFMLGLHAWGGHRTLWSLNDHWIGRNHKSVWFDMCDTFSDQEDKYISQDKKTDGTVVISSSVYLSRFTHSPTCIPLPMVTIGRLLVGCVGYPLRNLSPSSDPSEASSSAQLPPIERPEAISEPGCGGKKERIVSFKRVYCLILNLYIPMQDKLTR